MLQYLQPSQTSLYDLKLTGFVYTCITTHGTSGLTSHPKDATILVKRLDQGHKLHNSDSNPHSADQKHQSSSSVFDTTPHSFNIPRHLFFYKMAILLFGGSYSLRSKLPAFVWNIVSWPFIDLYTWIMCYTLLWHPRYIHRLQCHITAIVYRSLTFNKGSFCEYLVTLAGHLLIYSLSSEHWKGIRGDCRQNGS